MVASALALASVAGCGVDVLDEVGGGGGGDVPERIAVAFEESCAIPGCHEGAMPASQLSLERSALPGLLDQMSAQESGSPLVEIGNVPGSVLAKKMMDEETRSLYGVTIVGSQMPLGGGDASDAENVALIIGWIAGATFPDGSAADFGDTDGFASDPALDP